MVPAPDVGGVRETIDLDVTGRVPSKEADASEFARIALSLWQNKSWHARAREQCPVFVQDRFGPTRAANALLACFGFKGALN